MCVCLCVCVYIYIYSLCYSLPRGANHDRKSPRLGSLKVLFLYQKTLPRSWERHEPQQGQRLLPYPSTSPQPTRVPASPLRGHRAASAARTRPALSRFPQCPGPALTRRGRAAPPAAAPRRSPPPGPRAAPAPAGPRGCARRHRRPPCARAATRAIASPRTAMTSPGARPAHQEAAAAP